MVGYRSLSMLPLLDIVNGGFFYLLVHPTSNQSIYRTDNDEYIRIKPLATHQRPTGAYTMTPPGSQTGSDTDLRAESPMDANESRGRFSVLNSRNGTSVTSTSAIRLAPAAGGIYATTSRYNNSSYISRQTDDSSYSGDFNGEYSSGYATGSSTPAYRQQPMFQNSVSLSYPHCRIDWIPKLSCAGFVLKSVTSYVHPSIRDIGGVIH